MLFDKNLTVPDSASAVQVEDRARAKVPDPFNALSLCKKSKDKKIVDKPTQLWEPQMQVGKKIASIQVSELRLTWKLSILKVMHRTCRKQVLRRRFRLPRFPRLHPSRPPPQDRRGHQRQKFPQTAYYAP
jgi:hypothetical protein